MAALVGIATSRGLRFELPPTATLGRATECAIVLADPLVSSRHAEIRRDPDGAYRIVDLGAKHGTFVNGTRVATATLNDGDEIIVGATRLAFEHRASIAGAGAVETSDRHIVQHRAANPPPTFPVADALGLPAAARAEYERLRVAYECGRVLTAPLALDDLLRRIVELAFELVPAERGAVLLADDTGAMTARIARRRDGGTGGVTISRTIVDAVIADRVGLIAVDASLDLRFGRARSVTVQGVRAALAVPMVHGDELLGVLYLDARTAGVFAERDLAVMGTVAGQAALAVVTARLRDSLDLQARSAAAAQVAAGLAHDFGNLLTTIMNTAQLIELAPENHRIDTRALAGRIGAAASHAARLTRRLGALAQGGRSDRRALDLDEVVAETAGLLGAVLGRTEIDVVRAGTACPVLADPAELEQILLNLAFNARDAMDGAGRITIAVARPPDDPAHAVLTVTDNGAGMSPEVARRAFEPLFTTKPPGRGTGLGLALVHRLVTAAGGTVAIESEVGRGTTVAIRWPLIAPMVAVEPAGEVRGTGELVVVVDADDDVRGVTQALLERAGHRVIAVATGEVALAAIADQPVRAVVVDLGLDGVTARQLAERARGVHPDLAVVYVSAYTATAEIEEITAAGDGFVPKPFGAELAHRLAAALHGDAVPPPPRPAQLVVSVADGAALLARYAEASRSLVVPSAVERAPGDRVSLVATFEDSGRAFRLFGRVVERAGDGVRVMAEDASQLDLVIAHARGEGVPYFQRAYPRIAARLPVRLTTRAGLIIVSHTQEISAGGFMLSTDHPIGVGSEVALQIRFPGHAEPFPVGGAVRSVIRTGPRRGVGIEVAFRTGAQRDEFARLVAELAP